MTDHAAEQELLARVPHQLFVAGEWVDASTGTTLAVEDPATGEVLTEVADASADDARAAMDAAASAQESWAATAPRERSDLLRAAYDGLVERTEEFALLMTLEMGKPLAESRGEVAYGAEFLRWFSEEAVRVQGRYGPNPEGTGRMVVSQHPVGPCYLITPWNFPLAMATRKIGPALAAGCTVVVKPASLTPLSTLHLVRLLEEVGLPAGVVNVLTTTDSKGTSEALFADPRLRKLSFTGSTPVGVSLLKQAADRVLRTSMELGGNAPFLVFEDADVDQAVDGLMAAKFRNIGEACTAANRVIVHESVADQVAEKVAGRVRAMRVGRGTAEGVDIGPLISADAVQKVSDLVEDGRSRGASVVTGGRAIDGPGTFYEPTVITGVRPDADLMTHEIFGPVVSMTTFGDEDEAVAIANDTDFGLVSYAYTQDMDRAQRLMSRLESGMLGINVGVVSNAAAPFGGVKLSGLGREGGAEGIHEYLETRYALLPDPFA